MTELPFVHGKLRYSGSSNDFARLKTELAEFALLLMATDYLCIIMIPAIGCIFASGQGSLQKNMLFWNLLAAITVSLVASYSGYRNVARSYQNKRVELAIGCYWATTGAMLLAAVFLGHQHAVSEVWTTAEFVGTPTLLALTRTIPLDGLLGAESHANAGPIIICYDKPPRGIMKALADQQMPLNVSGILYLASNGSGLDTAGWPVIANTQALLETIRARQIQDIIIVYQPELELISPAARQDLLSELLPYPARIWLAFNLPAQISNVLASKIGDFKLMPIVTDRLVNSLNPLKRGFDIAVSAALLVPAVPVLAVIACLVRLSGPGPVIFRQIRIGAHGHRFTVLKFRTMRHAAGSAFSQATQNDTRVTAIGRFLRRASLDELLQLINVLKGDMSLVGPRPHAPETQVQGMTFENALKAYRLRHRVKPGITGLAQVRGYRGETRGLENLEQRLASDLEYIETWSVWLDIAILVRTVPAMMLCRNAW